MNNSRVRALLFSNSTNLGSLYLAHAGEAILTFLGGIKSVFFVPFALKNHDAYTDKARTRFKEMDIELTSAHESRGINGDYAIFVGGGNTFRLLAELRRRDLLTSIVRNVQEAGVPYIGASAGTNLACPSIMTTNDMPILNPGPFDALNFISYQINPHYPEPGVLHVDSGETREDRIKEYHEENNTPVIGLREGSWIELENGVSRLRGPKNAHVFMPGITFQISAGSEIERNFKSIP
ncbi:MAG TPA: dipeptidase PepE [Candidatus Paceibacterota bacterium]